MEDMNYIRENYTNFLNDREKNIKALILKLQGEDRIDEANLEKIKLNVVEIFSKMFIISNNNDLKILSKKYLSFFDKITEPWHINRDKALEFKDDKNVLIEEIKIQEAENLKKKFQDMIKLEVV